MPRLRMALAAGTVLLLSVPSSGAAASKGLLRISEDGRPVAKGAEVGYRLVLAPDGYAGTALQVGGGPLVNEAKADGFRTTRGADGPGGWIVHGVIESITLASNGKATIVASGEAIANNEPEPPPPPLVRSSIPKWECFFPLPKTLKGTFSTTGMALVTGTASTKASKLCHLPALGVSFSLELLPESLTGPVLETSLVA